MVWVMRENRVLDKRDSVEAWLERIFDAAATYEGSPHSISANAKLNMIWLDSSGNPTGAERGNLNAAERAYFRRHNNMVPQWRNAGRRGVFWNCVVCRGPERESSIRINIIWDDSYFLVNVDPLMRSEVIEFSKVHNALLIIPNLSIL